MTSDNLTKVRAPRVRLVAGLRRDQCEVVLEVDHSAFIQASHLLCHRRPQPVPAMQWVGQCVCWQCESGEEGECLAVPG